MSTKSIKSKTIPIKKMPYTCKECKLEFYSREGLEVHVLRKHTTPVPKGLDHFS
jgi:hypothetical protein